MSRTFFAVLSQQSTDRLVRLMESPPFEIDVTKFVVRLASNVSPHVKDKPDVYVARVTSITSAYNEELAYPELVAKLEAPELQSRAVDLGAPAEVELELVLCSPAPAHSRRNRHWIVSVEDALVMREAPLVLLERSIDG